MSWLTLLLLVAVTVNIVYSSPLKDEWTEFKGKHSKHYTEEEDPIRKGFWEKTRKFIQSHNEAADKGEWTFRVGMNRFGDMTEEERLTMTKGVIRRHDKLVGANDFSLDDLEANDLPPEVDWRKKNAVTPVQNQGMCGSSYAFSATGSLEGQIAIKHANLTLLSAQNLIDCSRKQGNFGCNGGYMDNCFKYIQQNKGIDSDAVYPYQGINGKCRFLQSGVVATDFGFVDIPTGSEAALQRAVAEIGPIASAIDASQSSFLFYQSGIYDDPNCSSKQVDLGILVAGYGMEQGKDYWLLKNVFGVDWGMKGYVLLARNKGNRCGIATVASYPIV